MSCIIGLSNGESFISPSSVKDVADELLEATEQESVFVAFEDKATGEDIVFRLSEVVFVSPE